MTNAELRSCYKRYNRKYFGGKLPAASVTFSKLSKRCLGIAHVELAEIEISKEIKYWTSIVRGTLLHEMAHLNLPPKVVHGPRFEKEMLRLAKAGAFRGIW